MLSKSYFETSPDVPYSIREEVETNKPLSKHPL